MNAAEDLGSLDGIGSGMARLLARNSI